MPSLKSTIFVTIAKLFPCEHRIKGFLKTILCFPWFASECFLKTNLKSELATLPGQPKVIARPGSASEDEFRLTSLSRL
jgi:hypothetical protein